jgi:hypothetical protein
MLAKRGCFGFRTLHRELPAGRSRRPSEEPRLPDNARLQKYRIRRLRENTANSHLLGAKTGESTGEIAYTTRTRNAARRRRSLVARGGGCGQRRPREGTLDRWRRYLREREGRPGSGRTALTQPVEDGDAVESADTRRQQLLGQRINSKSARPGRVTGRRLLPAKSRYLRWPCGALGYAA